MFAKLKCAENKPLPQQVGDCYLIPQVLIAEDCEETAAMLEHLFSEAGAEVTVTENGEQCVAYAMTAHNEWNPFDLIVLDIKMPIMDGFNASRLVREMGYQGPILALTGNPSREGKRESRQSGVTEYFSKANLRPESVKEMLLRYC